MFKSKEEYERFKKQYETMNRYTDSLIVRKEEPYLTKEDVNFLNEMYEIFLSLKNNDVDLDELETNIKIRKTLNKFSSDQIL